MRLIVRHLISILLLCLGATHVIADEVFQSEQHAFRAVTVVEGLQHPWGMAFLPDGRILVTERGGRLRVVQEGQLLAKPVSGLPKIKEHGQGGLLDVALHPAYEQNRLIYLSFAGKGKGGYGTEVIRGELQGQEMVNVKTIFKALPKSKGGRHFGSRLLFDKNGHLFITLGDRGERENGQRLATHAGSLIRVNDDGSVPADNPFVDDKNARAEIYTLGNRNMQGIALKPDTNEVWTHEHGPQGGDEINVMRPGSNYGWATITYGVNYVVGTKIGEGTEKTGMEQPIHYWVPSIAPSGMTFYEGNEFPKWTNNLFVGSLKFGQLVRLEIEGQNVVHEERLLNNALGRIRDVRQGPDGALYLLTDESKGRLIKLVASNPN